VRLGLGARYEYGGSPGKPATQFGTYQSEHVGFLPLLIGAAWQLANSAEQVEGLFGIGLS